MKKISAFPSLLALTICALGLTACIATAAVVDSDGDGVNDYRENKDGTNPNDPSSFNPLSKGLVLFYPFRGNLNDESGHDNYATTNGAFLTQDMFNVSSSAIQVGQYDGLRSATNVGIYGNADFSVSFWMKPTSNPTFHAGRVLQWGSGRIGVTSFYYRPYQTNANLHIDEWDVGTLVRSSSSDLTGNWSQVSYTYSGTNRLFSIFVNGDLQTNNFAGVNMELHNLVDSPLYVGGVSKTGDFPPDEYGDRGLDGCLDNIRIYNRRLSTSEVSSLYNAERPVYEVTLTLKSSTNLSHWTNVLTNIVQTFNAQEFYKKDISVRMKDPLN